MAARTEKCRDKGQITFEWGEMEGTEVSLDSFQGTAWEVITTFPAPWWVRRWGGGLRDGDLLPSLMEVRQSSRRRAGWSH